MCLALTNLCFLASNTAICVLPDVGLDVRPPIVSSDEFLHLVPSWMSRGDGVMMRSDDVFSKFFVFWDIDAFLPFD